MSGVDLGPILFGVDGTNYNILKYDDDDSTETRNHTKGIIWFTSDGTAGSIELNLRFFDKSITHFVILSRCVEGKVNLGFSPNIFDVSSTVGDVPLYFEDLNMNRRKIKNLDGPTDDGDVTNKKYVDDENAKQDKASKSYVDDKNAKQDIAINDKASKSELVNFSSINTGLGYNNPAKSSFSYVMINRPYSRENEKNFVFDGSVVSFIANTASNANSTTLTIPYKGKYKLILKEELPFTGDSSLKIDLSWTESSGIKTKNVYSENFSLPPGATIYFNPYELNFDLFVDYENSNLKIYVTGRIYFAGNVLNFPAFFGLYLDSDVLRKREAVKKYLKLNGNNKMKSDLDIDGNHILKVENLTDYKDTDPYDYRVKDVKSVVNKEYLNENFMKKVDKDGKEYYDLKQLVIKNSAPHDDGSYDNNTLVSKAFVNAEIAKLPKPATDVLKLDGSKAMTGNLDMGDHTITGIRSSAADNAALTVGGAKATYLPLLGDRSMQGNLNMGGHAIINIKPFVEDDSSQAVSDAQRNEVINFGYFHTERGELKRLINSVSSNALNRKNPDPMEDDIDMANHSIINLKEPEDHQATYAANVKFVANAIVDNNTTLQTEIDSKIKASEERSIRAVQQENVFEKVMVEDLFILDDDDIHKVAAVDKNFHKINQQTYQFKIDYDSSIGYYSTRLGVNVIYLPIGYYIIAFEMFFGDKIDPDNITVDCKSGTLQILSKNTKYSSDHSRSIFNFRKTVARPSDDELDIDIALKNKASEPTYDAKTDIYVVVYGVEGLGNDVDTRLWDRYFYVDDKKIHFEAPIDMVDKDIENVNNLSINNELNMNNKQIKNLGDGTENSDGVNVKQLNDLETKVTSEIGKVNPVLKNNSDFIKFIYRNLIRNDSKLFLIKELYFPDSVQGRTQNNYTYQTNGDNKGDVTFYLTFIHKATTSDSVIIALHWEAGRPIYIFVSKSSVVASENLLINEPSLKSYNIPSYYIGKQVYLWITIQNDLIQINFSGSRAITVTHPFIFHKDANLRRIDVSDSPFTIQRGLITKNIYNVDSVAYGDVREYEISEGTFVSAV